MPTHPMLQLIHRGVWQISRRKGPKNISRPPPLNIYTAPPQETHWILINSISYIRKSKASPGPSRRQCSYVYRTPPPQSQHWQIPTATHLGPASTIIASFPTKTNINTIHHANNYPLLVSPHTLPTHPPYCCTSMQGGHHNFLTFIPIGKYMHTPPYTPSLYLHVDLQQCHLG